jgi:hypothetical protein
VNHPTPENIVTTMTLRDVPGGGRPDVTYRPIDPPRVSYRILLRK